MFTLQTQHDISASVSIKSHYNFSVGQAHKIYLTKYSNSYSGTTSLKKSSSVVDCQYLFSFSGLIRKIQCKTSKIFLIL
jgi:hypothetical protein